uniref:Uncharacterized protein n=1 Tax=Pithovirus LCPAC103 TaxID=2506588 RepID=A0A481Z3N8_9VIRU|nr:MAG: hypothetical protein LCPAC103_01280 [Pithovirus LCPAC103]
MPTDEEWVVIVVSIILVVALIVYFAVLIWAKENRRWMFAPYVPPPLPNGYNVNGQVKELTPEQQENRRKMIEAAIRQNKGLEEQSTVDIPVTDSTIDLLTIQA